MFPNWKHKFQNLKHKLIKESNFCKNIIKKKKK